MTPFDASGKQAFRKLCEKGENAGNQNVFYSIKDRNVIFVFWFIICKYFQFGLIQNFVIWEWVNLS